MKYERGEGSDNYGFGGKKSDLPEVARTPMLSRLYGILESIKELSSAYNSSGMPDTVDERILDKYFDQAEEEFDRLRKLRNFYSS